jgi:alcohol dehydrogenase (cytochrome c)
MVRWHCGLFYGALALMSTATWAQPPDPAHSLFDRTCAVCHSADGGGGEMGPNIVNRVAALTDAELTAIIRGGIPTRGMPATPLTNAQAASLIGVLRALRPAEQPAARRTVTLVDGRSLDGLVLNQSTLDLQLRTDDQRIHLLRMSADRYREVTSEVSWPTYNGDWGGNRFTPLTQITPANIGHLANQWMFTMEGGTTRSETTPVVSDGVMYVTSANECWALDAGSGRQLWHYQRPRTRGLIGNASQGFNRGVAVAGELVFMVTDHAHLIALRRATGELVWDTEMADWHQNYNATSAPLIVGNLVLSGTAGGEQGVRGFVAAFDQATGKEVWRTWTVPRRGEPGSETWQGKAIDHPSAVTWFTGTYDAALGLVYWPTGNPGPDYDGDERLGDNLYSDSILALDAQSGKMKWHYQFTPHDIHDWDSTEPPVLVDAAWQGTPRKLLIQANRNGFFYVLDRTDGTLLLARPFVNKLTWAKEIGSDGRPVLLPLPESASGGTRVCPDVYGATNWFSTSYNANTGLFYVESSESCSVYYKRAMEWEAGRGYTGGSQRLAPGEEPRMVLRAIDIHTGKIAWELPQGGQGSSFGGTLATATGLVFFCEDSGMLMAVDATTGKVLWHFQTSTYIKASPMTYQFDGKQYVAIAVGQNILAFALND